MGKLPHLLNHCHITIALSRAGRDSGAKRQQRLVWRAIDVLIVSKIDKHSILALPAPLRSDLIVLRSFVKMGEYRSRLIRDNGYCVILSCKLTDGIQRIK